MHGFGMSWPVSIKCFRLAIWNFCLRIARILWFFVAENSHLSSHFCMRCLSVIVIGIPFSRSRIWASLKSRVPCMADIVLGICSSGIKSVR